MSFLTPLGALVAFLALAPIAAGLVGRRRVGAVRSVLGLPAPTHAAGLVRLASATAGIAVLGLAAAQPVLTHTSKHRTRTGVQALFVLDTSRSMAASATRTSPTRLDRAVAAAVRLRAAIPDVASGIATVTDRVLPDLFPVADAGAFDGVAQRAVGIELPPPRDATIRATSLGALTQVASGEYFAPGTSKRIVVLLTDGETDPLNPGEVARTLSADRGYRFLAIRFWHDNESVFDQNGKAEAGYRPDPSGKDVLASLAAATKGKSFEEGSTGSAVSDLTRLVGHGPTKQTVGGTLAATPLAPYVAVVSLLLLLGAFVAIQPGTRALQLPQE
jgi:hypothetical protein